MGPQPQQRGFPDGRVDVAAAIAKVLGELDDEDRVLRGQADRRQQIDLEVDVVGLAEQQRAEHADGNGEKDRERDRPALVKGGETQEYDDQRDGMEQSLLRAGQPLLVGEPRPCHAVAAVQLADEGFHAVQGRARTGAAGGRAAHGDGRCPVEARARARPAPRQQPEAVPSKRWRRCKIHRAHYEAVTMDIWRAA